MLGVYVTVPVACFRKGLAREYLETEPIPPPGHLLWFSVVAGRREPNRRRHIGCRVSPALVSNRRRASCCGLCGAVKKMPLGSPGNTRPDYQQLLTGIEAGHLAGLARGDRTRAAIWRIEFERRSIHASAHHYAFWRPYR